MHVILKYMRSKINSSILLSKELTVILLILLIYLKSLQNEDIYFVIAVVQ